MVQKAKFDPRFWKWTQTKGNAFITVYSGKFGTRKSESHDSISFWDVNKKIEFKTLEALLEAMAEYHQEVKALLETRS